MVECCSELAQMQRDGYQPKDWSMQPEHHQPVGRHRRRCRFLLAGFPIASRSPAARRGPCAHRTHCHAG